MNHKRSVAEKSAEEAEKPMLNCLTLPMSVAHVKTGHTLCTDGNILLFQDGPTTIEYRAPPKFQSKRVPWRGGLIRDMVWSPDLGLFVILTKESLIGFNPNILTLNDKERTKALSDLTVGWSNKLRPYDRESSFWRCTTAGTTIYICYSGFGTIIDEYVFNASSYRLVNRWTPPLSCAYYEGIWCMRYHSAVDQLGFSIMDARTNRWRFEVRSRQQLNVLWRVELPLEFGDCEIFPLTKPEWLAVNSCGIRLIQIENEKLKAAVEYERELKNAITIGNSYFVVRTKSTIEIHQLNQSK